MDRGSAVSGLCNLRREDTKDFGRKNSRVGSLEKDEMRRPAITSVELETRNVSRSAVGTSILKTHARGPASLTYQSSAS
jgi:hypothetical protein